MPFVEAKCTNCGANLTVDNSLEAAVCDYCGTPYIVEKAINNFLDAKIGKIENANIIIHDEKSLEKQLDRADAFLNIHEDYDKACDIYESVTESYPREYRGWWGMICAKTCNFSYVPFNEGFLAELEYFFEHALKVAPDEEKNSIAKKWNGYINKWNEQINNKIGQAEEELGENTKRLKEFESTISELDLTQKEAQERLNSLQNDFEVINKEIDNLYKERTKKCENKIRDLFYYYAFVFVAAVVVIPICAGCIDEYIVDVFNRDNFDHFFFSVVVGVFFVLLLLFIIKVIGCLNIQKRIDSSLNLLERKKEYILNDMQSCEKSINNFHRKHSESSKLWDKSNSDEKGIEKKIIELKKMLKSVACPSCGVQLDCETEFCPQCGAKKY